MKFTQDWFTHNIPNFEKCMQEVGEERGVFLEIGCYEGRSTCWLLQNGLADDGEMICVDPFVGKDNLQDLDLMERFEDNVFKAQKHDQFLTIKRTFSYNFLAYRICDYLDYIDFAYIDGDHSPGAVLTDACMTWGMLRPGGVMLFDDYEYPHEPTKRGIDAFLSAYEGQYDIILKNYQLAVKKK